MRVLSPHDPKSNEFYSAAVELLQEQRIDFLIGGAFAMRVYTGIERNTKDLDIMIRPADLPRVLETFDQAGFRADDVFPHWLAKVHHGEFFIDIIYRAGNGLCEVDAAWFARAREAEVFGKQLPICPPEEMIWQKAFIMERERYDGADVQHLFLACADEMDWDHLVARFGPDWRILLSHLVLFGFVYPGERHSIPGITMQGLLDRAITEGGAPAENDRLCQGTLISRSQYLPDVERWGYRDARTEPRVQMTKEDLRQWTNAIDRGDRPV